MRVRSVPSKLRYFLFLVLATAVAGATLNFVPKMIALQMGDGSPEAVHGPATIVLQNSYELPAKATSRPEGTARPTALATADFDVDGYPDLVSGYAGGDGGYLVIQRGNPEAFAPTLPENIDAISKSRFPVSFLPEEQVIQLSSAPDFIVVGDFDRDSNPDIITASRGDSALHFAAGDGKGGFGSERTIEMSGRITSLAAGEIDIPDNRTDLAVGVDGEKGASLLVFEGVNGIEDAPVAYGLPAPADMVAIGQMDDSAPMDVTILAGGQVSILHGRNQNKGRESAKSSTRLETIAMPFGVRSMAVGQFIWDRDGRNELALLRDDGTVAFATRGEQDTRPFTVAEVRELRRQEHMTSGKVTAQKDWQSDAKQAWSVAEEMPAMDATGVNAASGSTLPVMFNARLSGQSVDDLVVLDPATRELKIYAVETPDKVNGEVVSFAGPRSLMSMPAASAPLAALSMRTGLFSRPGLVFLRDGAAKPEIIPAAPTASFTVTKSTDGNDTVCDADCSLREAIQASNAGAGADIITVPNGTYTLTIAGSDDTALSGDLDVNDEATFNGASAAGTVIQAGSTNANGIDKVMGYNPTCVNPLNGSINNVTIKNGRNLDTFNATFSQTGGGLDYCTPGTATLSISNSTFDSNTVSFAYGGGMNFDAISGTQTVNLTNVTISNNKTVNTPGTGSGARGGGLSIFDSGVGTFTLTNCNITGNNAQTSGSGDGQGGGISISPQGGGSTLIHGSTISNNTAKSSGGGIAIFPTVAAHNVTIDQSSVISGNTSSGTGAGNNAEGGGVWNNSLGGGTTTITKTTITGNTANTAPTGNNIGGGGLDFAAGNATVSFSRIVGNTATNGNGARKDSNAGTVTATDNWWGCSGGPNTSGCSTTSVTAPGVLTTSPFLQLRTTAATNPIVTGQTSALTTSFLTDSGNNVIAVGNLSVLIGLPVSWSSVGGGISFPQTTIQAAGTATATFTATAAGAESATAQVDGGPASGSTNTVAITVNKDSTTTTITSDIPDPSAPGQAVTVTYTVAGNSPGGGTPTGSVQVTDGVDSCTGTVAAGQCVITLNTVGNRTLTATYLLGDANYLASPASAGVSHVVTPPLAAAKSFSPAQIQVGGISTLTIDLSTTSATPFTNISFTDTFPAGMSISSLTTTNTCGGAFTPALVVGATSFGYAGGGVPANGSCSLSVQVTAASAGVLSNQTSAVSSTEGGAGSPSNIATLTVVGPPAFTKGFTPSTIVFGQTSTLGFVLTNNNPTAGLTGIAFGDTLPAGMTVATSGPTATCGGSLSTTAPSTIAFSGGTLAAAGGTCTVNATVTGTAIGTFTNTSGAVSSTEGGPGGTATAQLIVNKANTTVALTTSGSPSVFGQSVTFTATISVTAPGSGSPTGTVTFLDNAVNIGTCATQAVAASVATCSISTLAVGSHPITAVYNGDGNFNASPTSNTVTQVVNKANTTVVLGTSGSPSVFGQSVTFTATISVTAPGAGTPTGTVTFLDNAVNIATCATQAVALNVATCSINTLAVGSHPITAVYNGDGNFNASPASNTVTQVVNKADTTMALGTSGTPSVFGQLVTFTATISVTSPGTGGPTGTITFKDNAVNIATCAAQVVALQAATCSISTLSVGSHPITAVYNGDASFNASPASNTVTQVVNKADTTVALGTSGSPTVFGQSVTFTATISVTAPGSGSPTGTVTFLDNAVNIGTCATQAVAANVATCSISTLAVGSHPITAIYNGDASFNASPASNTVTQVVNKASTTVALGTSGSPTVFGQSVTFTATISVTAPGSGSPTGTVTFKDNAVNIGTCATQAVAANVATCSISTLAVGSHPITAVYNGDGNFNASPASNTVTQVVNKASTTVALGTSGSPSVFGQTVTFTATISVTAPGSGSPTGTVTFMDNAVNIGTCATQAVALNVATCSISTLAVGSHPITAVYNGDGNFNASPVSNTVTQVVNKANTTVALGTSGSPSVFGQSVTFTATISVTAPGSGSPTGTVTFKDNAVNIGTCAAQAVAANVATCSISTLAIGSHPITAVYNGDGNFNASPASSTLTQVVNKADTTVALGTSGSPTVFGQSVTFTATISVTAPGSGSPTGTVTFRDNAVNIGTCATQAVAANVATCSISTLAIGSHPITAIYNGDPSFNASPASNTVTQVVNKANTTVALGTSGSPTALGQPVTFTATISVTAPGIGTPTGTVTFLDNAVNIGTCAAQPVAANAATCTISTLAAGSHPITAVYNGDGNFNASPPSNTVTQVVVAPPVIAKVFNPNAIPTGGTTSLDFTITNPAANTVASTGVAFTDNLPAGLTVANATTTPCGGTLTTTSPTSIILSGATVNGTCTFSVTVTGAAAGQYTNTTGSVTSTNGGTGNTASANLTVSSADLSITKTDGVTTAAAGSTVVYTITVTNNGPNAVTGATVADTFVSPITGVQWTCSGTGGGACNASGTGNINQSVNLPVGATVTFLAAATINPAAAAGSLVNTATVATPAGTTDPNPANNSATDTDTIVLAPDLAITKTDGSATYTAGTAVSYTIVASNNGPSNATGASVSDAIPASITSPTISCVPSGTASCGSIASVGNSFSFTGVNIPAGAGNFITITASGAVAPGTTGNLVNTATVTAGAGQTDPTPGNNSATDTDTPNPIANLAITKTDAVNSTPAGSTVLYTITASNAGPSNATGSTVVDTLPAAITGATWICAGVGGGVCGNGSGTGSINQTVNLPVGSSVTYTVSAAIDPAATGTLSNTATVAAAAGITDPTPGNNSATDTDTLTPPLVFAIDDVRKNEGNTGTTAFTFTVTRLVLAGTTTASVQYTTQDGSATAANGDYQPVSGTLTFAVGEATKTITVLVNGDTVVEPDEFFTVHLFSPSSGTAIQDPDGQGLIFNDDGGGQVPTPTPTPAGSGFEGDINRSVPGTPGTGDGDVTVGDQIQFLRFLSGLDCPAVGTANPALNEQQRLDAGDRSTLGDGLLGATDATAIDAYARHDAATDFNPNVAGWQPTPAGGPKVITNLGCTPSASPERSARTAAPESKAASATRVVRVVSRPGARGSDITVEIEMNAVGNEAGTQYSLHFDPAVLSVSDISGVDANPDITRGADAPAGTTLNVNAADAANGNIGIVENFNGASSAITAIPQGATCIAKVKFHVLDGAAAGTSRIDFDNSVINGVTSDTNGIALSANYESGSVSIASGAGVLISGRVTSSDGRGIRNATVTMVDQNGFARTVTTSAFGYYAFDGVAAGTRYTIAASSRQYRFAPRTLEITDNLADLDFNGQD